MTDALVEPWAGSHEECSCFRLLVVYARVPGPAEICDEGWVNSGPLGQQADGAGRDGSGDVSFDRGDEGLNV